MSPEAEDEFDRSMDHEADEEQRAMEQRVANLALWYVLNGKV